MVFKCPVCNSTLFHVEKVGSKVIIKCYRGKSCGWQMITEEK